MRSPRDAGASANVPIFHVAGANVLTPAGAGAPPLAPPAHVHSPPWPMHRRRNFGGASDRSRRAPGAAGAQLVDPCVGRTVTPGHGFYRINARLPRETASRESAPRGAARYGQ